ncbi:unnamed protein product [Citrullus colocynthis]|uniref:Uncharacterized protein n=1 Tax=Citrullus colocynthis TaxID=252529 RepID=A0ABP0Y1H6_9ROSI
MESIDETWALNWEGGKGIQRMGSHKIKREREIYVKKDCKPDIWFKLNRLSSPPLFITQFKTGKGGVNPLNSVAFEINALSFQEIDGIGSVKVRSDVEIPKIELPNEGLVGGKCGEVDVGVDVGLEEKVVIGEADEDAGEFSVHGNEREWMEEAIDEVEIPDLTEVKVWDENEGVGSDASHLQRKSTFTWFN